MIKRILAAAALVLALAAPSLAQNYVPAGGGSGATTCAGITDAGTVCPKNVGTSGATVPLNSTANTFSTIQTVNLNAAAPPTAITGTALQVFGADTVSGRVMAGAFGAIASVTVARADGTGASPTQVLSGEQIGGVNAYGYGSGAWQGPVVSFRSYAAENIDSTHYGSKACIATTPLASTTMADVFCVLNDGTLQINGNGIFGSTAAATFRHGGPDVDTAPVAQTIRTQGALAGGTSNVAGANLTVIVSPGKGTGAGGSFIVQTAPAGSTGTVVNSPVTALTVNSASQTLVTDGTSSLPSLGFASSPATGLWTPLSGAIGFGTSGEAFRSEGSLGLGMKSGSILWWTSSSTLGTFSSRDVVLSRLGVANLQLGKPANATPVANTLTIGESSRAGTDTNIAGANGTIQSGNGTGNAAVSGVTIQAPTAVASGSGAQTQTSVAVFKTTGVTITPGIIAGGSAPTLTGTCATTTQVGGNTAGSFVTSAGCSATTVIITFATTAPNGWVCDASDETTSADSLKQTGHTTTSCTLTGTTAAADVVVFHASAF